jgi:cyclase
MVAVATPEGKVAIDTTSYPLFARKVRTAVDQEVPGPWRFVINTHRHFDHIGGNQVFEDCTIIAASPTREVMESYSDSWLESRVAEWKARGLGFKVEWLGSDFRFVFPQVSFTGELRLQLGGTTLEVMRLGGHTPESSVVFLPGRGVLVVSDLIFNGRPAYLGEGDRWEWIEALATLQRLHPRVVVPGHGPVGGAELLEQQAAELQAGEE